jgi:hypothetical protein
MTNAANLLATLHNTQTLLEAEQQRRQVAEANFESCNRARRLAEDEVDRLREMVRVQPEWTPRASEPVPAREFFCIWCKCSALEGHTSTCQRRLYQGE